jgi:CheY-like chemotaxis protein
MLNKSVLLVEDDALDAEMTKDAVESVGGCSVTVVVNGQAALARLRETDYERAGAAPPPSLFLLDLALPLVDGLEVLREIRRQAQSRRIPIVVFTSSQREAEVYLSYQLGANAFVIKPLDGSQFRRVVEHTVRFWLHSNVLPPH